jgi:hypothetical protein
MENVMPDYMELIEDAALPYGYGYKIQWGNQSFAVCGCATEAEAKQKCIEWATKDGWTPPRWWQLWRWNDTRP